jgi:predicted dehydrogenase
MWIFDGERWHDGFLDEHRPNGWMRVRTTSWATIAELDDVAISPELSVRRVVDYARQLGPVRLARKVMSRFSQRAGHTFVVACGTGEVVEADDPGRIGESVVWFAPRAAPAAERLVLPKAFVSDAEVTHLGHFFVELQGADRGRVLELASPVVGWTPYAGVELPAPGQLKRLLEVCATALETALQTPLEHAKAPAHERPESPIREQSRKPQSTSVESTGRSVTVFGWGHHARTQILPAIPGHWRLATVHEIDPRLHGGIAASWDTSPHLRMTERADVVCAAGFHATHAPLAIEALRRGATVVVEKPVVTTQNQLDELLEAWVEPSRLFALYHRRYGAIARAIDDDLGGRGPIDMHSTVFEIPLPTRHWYRWPSSGGRIVGNGCHWIDQFLWLNPGADVVDASARRGPRGQIVATLSLSNGAFFSLTLTDQGSDRRGTREVTELRTDTRTARLVDGSEYVCEDGVREVRHLDVHPLDALESAYEAVFRAIDDGRPGDSRESVERTHRAMLRLAELAGPAEQQDDGANG